MGLTRGFIIWENIDEYPDSRKINSLELEDKGYYCLNEENIDNKSFSNEYIYDEYTDSHSLNKSTSNQHQFTLTFALAGVGDDVAAKVNNLRQFFNKTGHEFTIARNMNNIPNKFVVDSIETSHIGSSDGYLGFSVSCTYVGIIKNYELYWETERVGSSLENRFKFDAFFETPEPQVEFSELIKDTNQAIIINSELPNITGYKLKFKVLENFSNLTVSNVLKNDILKINYDFILNDIIEIDTYSEIPTMTLTRGGTRLSLVEFIDYQVSNLPMLYSGANSLFFIGGNIVGNIDIEVSYLKMIKGN